MNDLEMYREQLAMCDDKLIDALVERNGIIEKIMSYKETYGMPILQPAQEEKQEKRLEEKLQGNKYQEEIHDVFQRILRNSKRIQARKLFRYPSSYNLSNGITYVDTTYSSGKNLSNIISLPTPSVL